MSIDLPAHAGRRGEHRDGTGSASWASGPTSPAETVGLGQRRRSRRSASSARSPASRSAPGRLLLALGPRRLRRRGRAGATSRAATGLGRRARGVRRRGADERENRLLSILGVIRIGAQLDATAWPTSSSCSTPLNIFLGLFNLVPLLPFDGGHVAIADLRAHPLAAAARRYHVDVTKLLPVTYAVVMVLVVLGRLHDLPRHRRPPQALGSRRWSVGQSSYPRRKTRQIMVRRRAGRRRRADHGAVDDDHQDGRRRGHAAADLRAGRGRLPTSSAAPATRSRRPRAWPRSCPARRCRSSPTSTTSTGWRSPRSRPACTACASTPATSAGPSTSSSWRQEAKDRGVPIRIGVNGGSLDPDALREARRPGHARGDGRVGADASWPTSTRSASTT